MSDGPHKTLPMRPKWKTLSKRADNLAFSAEEVTNAVCPALAGDWSRDISAGMLRQLGVALGGEEPSLFPDQTVRAVETLRGKAASPLEAMLVEAACDAVSEGFSGKEALERAATEALFERALRGIRQVEEHWLREAREKRAENVRSRLEASIAAAAIPALAASLLNGISAREIQSPKRDSVEDGVPIER